MKYSIGEFAALLGVTVDTLRLYEKHGIINPIKDEKNNYRYFDDLDSRNLLMSRWYRSIQIPLQDAALLTKGSSLNNIIEKIREAQTNLEEEIKRSTILLNKIKDINNDFKKIELLLGKCTVKKMPGIYRLRQTNKNDLINEDFVRDMVGAWMNILPYTFFSFRIDKQEILSAKNQFEYSWGLAISEEEIHNFDIEINENIEYISPKTCLSSVVLSPHKEYLMRDTLQFMLDYIEANGYSITGDIIGRIIVTEKKDEIRSTYLEVNIPI